MKKLESFKKDLFSKETMKKIKGGQKMADVTKTRCDGTTTSMPDCSLVLDCPDTTSGD